MQNVQDIGKFNTTRPQHFGTMMARAHEAARLEARPMCDVAPAERLELDGVVYAINCANYSSFDLMAPSRILTVEITNQDTGRTLRFADVWSKTRRSKKTGKVTVRYSSAGAGVSTNQWDILLHALVAVAAQRLRAQAVAA